MSVDENGELRGKQEIKSGAKAVRWWGVWGFFFQQEPEEGPSAVPKTEAEGL